LTLEETAEKKADLERMRKLLDVKLEALRKNEDKKRAQLAERTDAEKRSREQALGDDPISADKVAPIVGEGGKFVPMSESRKSAHKDPNGPKHGGSQDDDL
jgi:hypothetical protein